MATKKTPEELARYNYAKKFDKGSAIETFEQKEKKKIKALKAKIKELEEELKTATDLDRQIYLTRELGCAEWKLERLTDEDSKTDCLHYNISIGTL